MNWQKYFLQELKKFTSPQRCRIFSGESYIGGGQSKLKFFDLKTSDVRSLLKRPLPLFDQTVEQQFRIFEKIWFSANIFELKVLPLYWLETLSTKQLISFSPALILWAPEADNWALADNLCGQYAKIFELAPKNISPIYKLWNKHPNPWLRRISMVGLMYYSRSRKKWPSFQHLKTFVYPHLNAEEYYVQKAVGWTIREFYNVYPLETLRFLEEHLHRVQADAWYAASEKLKPLLKNNLVKKRRQLRALKKDRPHRKPKNGALDRI